MTAEGRETVRERARMHMFRLGSQYYLAGRFSVIAQLVPAAGNLLHHAIEMFLKGALLRSHDLNFLWRKCGHDLGRLWDLFKHDVGDDSVETFDRVVGSLQKFERVRYPDNVLKEGAAFSFGLFKGDQPEISQREGVSVPGYTLALEEIDELAFLIFRKSKTNPAFFFHGAMHPKYAFKFLRLHNKHLPLEMNENVPS